MSYSGFSIQTNNQLTDLEARHDQEVAQLNVEIATQASEASAARTLIQSNLDAEVSRAVAKENELNSKIDQEVADRVEAVENEKVAREQADEALSSRVGDLEAWKTENTNTLQKAIDDAISDNTTLINQVETQLNDADSALSQRISGHIADRVATDEQHKVRLAMSSSNDQAMKQVLEGLNDYLKKFAQTYTITDATGAVVSPPDFMIFESLLAGIQQHDDSVVVNGEAVADPVLAGSL